MKRQAYQEPTMVVVRLQHRGIICTSVTGLSSNASLGLGGGGDTDARSRDFGDWDEE